MVGGIRSLISWLNSKSWVFPTEMEAAVSLRTLGPPIGCTIPGYNTIAQLRAHFVQGQQELNGTPTIDPKNAAPKRPYSLTTKGPHSPTLGECPKKTMGREKVRKEIEVVLIIYVE